MNPKVVKIFAVVGGVIVVWFLTFVIFGKSKEPVQTTTIEFWNVFDKSDDIEPLLADFTGRTKIKVNYRSFTDLQEYRDTLLLELAAGEGPDVFAVHANWIPKYKSLLRPLPPELGYTEQSVQRDFVDAVAASLVEKEQIPEADAKSGREAGVFIYGLPMYVDTLALFYNQSFFRNILSKPYPEPELTWAGVRNDSVGLTARDDEDPEGFQLAGIALGRADNISRGVELFYTIYGQFGGQNLAAGMNERVQDDGGKSYQPLQAALDFFVSFSDDRKKEYSWNSKIAAGAPEKELDAFVRGKVAMVAGYSYYDTEIKNLIEQKSRGGARRVIQPSDVGIAPLPQVYDPRAGNPKKALAEFFALSVAKNSQNPQAAWQLILDLTGQEMQKKYHTATGKPTSRRDLIEEQKAEKPLGVFAEQAVYADVLPTPDDEKYAATVREAIRGVADGEVNSSDAVKWIVSELAPKE